ncbi:General stress protein 16O [Gemmata sp. SH-PL17]|uniref:Zinc finger DksA/TraR C4-type domain-containing protein n=1 Tax=Gemmata massiliana TaxID=1210884 RepID=A0A6P2D4T4_9BACT|nr:MULTISPECIES: TraR/DksA C4-type zinc finger protein [Gemmata]AMV25074.1 General stress protein 16O [Gemmata sp. SH-PL17]VTR96311.1 suppressor protein : DnaK suppressor protein OS=Singulisphaera acidiphila (strain ATCC BAA-1392 / DSM 18658 / VKM B-2454 / MOB10) GN=Sinac_5080 PE=4 SV=1: zf-dskA_traR [Gemmata massiliana]
MARQDALLRLHKSLIARRTELRKRLGLELEELAHIKHSSASGDAADAAFDASGEEISSTLAELEAKELAQIERALRRLKAGTYGKCEVCAIKIPVARLNALPFSTLCVKCQREMELDGGWAADHVGTDWGRISDGNPMEDREFRLADIESDLGK